MDAKAEFMAGHAPTAHGLTPSTRTAAWNSTLSALQCRLAGPDRNPGWRQVRGDVARQVCILREINSPMNPGSELAHHPELVKAVGIHR